GAARRAHPWGDEPPSAAHLNACGAECAARGMYEASDGYAASAPRGSFPAGRTPEGVWDLAGNVAEWVDAAPASLVLGGSYEDVDPLTVSSGHARPVLPTTRRPTIGFRCAKD